MIKQSASEIFTLLVVLASAMVVSAEAAPGVARRPIRDEPPKLSDTLAVAKSPYEPVTLAAQLVGDPPNARNDSPPTVVASELNSDESQQALKTTRSTQAGVIEQQEKDTTPIRGLDEQSSDDSQSSSSATTSSPAIGGPEATTDTSTATVDGTEAGSTTSKEEPTEATSTTPSSATDTTLGTTTTTVAPTEAAETTTAAPATTEAPSSSSTEVAAEDSSAATKAQELVTGEPAASTTAAVAATETTTTAAPERSDEAPKEQAKPIPEKEETSPAPTPEATTTTAPVESPATEAPTTPAATTTTTTITTTEPPTTSTTTAPAEPKQEERSKEEARQQPQTSCNHLPTYDAEEVQKVFREETTFRNGTIRGKFTYINFDSRYRLVHYTRLPYGPVKIDLVEELGRPEPASNGSRLSPTSASSSSATAPPNEVPNAVLQLRNILPNSLFGFPFVAPNSVPSNKPLDPRDGATSPGSNLYSTEALATPNLPLSPSVPVSSLSGRREPGQMHAGAAASPAMQDTLAQNLNDDIALSVNQPVATPLRPAQPRQAIQLGDTWESQLQQAAAAAAASGPSANNLQFQYALSTQANHLEAAAKQAASGPAYTYFGGQPASSYQYSPLPLYTFQQPSYFSAHHHHNQLPLQTATIAVAAPVQPANKPALVSHQPHDHEHFIAPFMLSQAPSSEQPASDQPTRLKLRVKSAKSLNHNSGLKSAQLRATQDESVSSQQQQQLHHYSPAQAYRQSSSQGRHRAGKQNQELRPTVNAAPIVYHVLRSPVGRMYSLPQYRNVHAVAYDLDV